ncbi:phytanoyl-CoA dioxygenase family protein [Burkholderia multivorans]|uniref:phytanoyl-CoA dioxygenase family protein n=1 Tax=Burkholderia multivorans TaxID=87883 RepID=UPI001F1538B8|nr:phytanoyl-CoA dioxygenase family protein [Burkholderia multivorans]
MPARRLGAARHGFETLRRPARFYSDHVFAKARATEADGDTPWHQDFRHHPHDRQGALNIWIALVDCPPEKGTMRILEGSHRAGQLGRYFNRRDNVTLIEEHPRVLGRYRMSDPIHLKAGDATVHDMAVIHAAPEITTDEPRWVYRLHLAMLCRPKESRPEMRHYYFAPTRRDAIETITSTHRSLPTYHSALHARLPMS